MNIIDINLAAYLAINDLEFEMHKNGNKASFVFDKEKAELLVKKYYKNDGKFMSFANTVRNFKSRIANMG